MIGKILVISVMVAVLAALIGISACIYVWRIPVKRFFVYLEEDENSNDWESSRSIFNTVSEVKRRKEKMSKRLIISIVLMALGAIVGITGLANLTGLTFTLGVYHPKPSISLLVYLGGMGLILLGLRLWVLSNENKNT